MLSGETRGLITREGERKSQREGEIERERARGCVELTTYLPVVRKKSCITEIN